MSALFRITRRALDTIKKGTVVTGLCADCECDEPGIRISDRHQTTVYLTHLENEEAVAMAEKAHAMFPRRPQNQLDRRDRR